MLDIFLYLTTNFGQAHCTYFSHGFQTNYFFYFVLIFIDYLKTILNILTIAIMVTPLKIYSDHLSHSVL